MDQTKPSRDKQALAKELASIRNTDANAEEIIYSNPNRAAELAEMLSKIPLTEQDLSVIHELLLYYISNKKNIEKYSKMLEQLIEQWSEYFSNFIKKFKKDGNYESYLLIINTARSISNSNCVTYLRSSKIKNKDLLEEILKEIANLKASIQITEVGLKPTIIEDRDTRIWVDGRGYNMKNTISEKDPLVYEDYKINFFPEKKWTMSELVKIKINLQVVYRVFRGDKDLDPKIGKIAAQIADEPIKGNMGNDLIGNIVTQKLNYSLYLILQRHGVKKDLSQAAELLAEAEGAIKKYNLTSKEEFFRNTIGPLVWALLDDFDNKLLHANLDKLQETGSSELKRLVEELNQLDVLARKSKVQACEQRLAFRMVKLSLLSKNHYEAFGAVYKMVGDLPLNNPPNMSDEQKILILFAKLRSLNMLTLPEQRILINQNRDFLDRVLLLRKDGADNETLDEMVISLFREITSGPNRNRNVLVAEELFRLSLAHYEKDLDPTWYDPVRVLSKGLVEIDLSSITDPEVRQKLDKAIGDAKSVLGLNIEPEVETKITSGPTSSGH